MCHAECMLMVHREGMAARGMLGPQRAVPVALHDKVGRSIVVRISMIQILNGPTKCARAWGH